MNVRALLPLLSLAALSCTHTSRGAVDLRETDTRVVRFGFVAPRGGICPGEPLDVDLELETNAFGGRTSVHRHRVDLEDAIFDLRQIRLSSPQGRFDDDGRFYPNPDPLASVQTGFSFFVGVPRGPTFSVRYPPVYECGSRIGRPGQKGIDGETGDAALTADVPASVTEAAAGAPGQAGGNGGDGPRFTVYVTWVKTTDYDRLLAARAEGDVNGIALAAPGTPLAVIARGGQGGTGGRGGEGGGGAVEHIRYGKKGHVISATVTPGGHGGEGGIGGEGGRGGDITIVLDERFPDLDGWVHADAAGGTGGIGGMGGAGGERAGFDTRTSNDARGAPGAPGHDGHRGQAGSTTRRSGDVVERFADLRGLVVL